MTINHTIREIQTDEGLLLKKIRSNAVQDTPLAFGTSIEEIKNTSGER